MLYIYCYYSFNDIVNIHIYTYLTFQKANMPFQLDVVCSKLFEICFSSMGCLYKQVHRWNTYSFLGLRPRPMAPALLVVQLLLPSLKFSSSCLHFRRAFQTHCFCQRLRTGSVLRRRTLRPESLDTRSAEWCLESEAKVTNTIQFHPLCSSN